MKATDLLKAQHQEVHELFKKIEASKDQQRKAELFEELARNLAAHDAIERQVFYPACEKTMGLDGELGEALVEHGVIEFELYCAVQALGENDFDFKVTVLRELVEHHVKEEEKEFFPKVEKAFAKDRLEQLGKVMSDRFETEKGHDYRGALRHNLQQVLDGAMKPTPKDVRPQPVV